MPLCAIIPHAAHPIIVKWPQHPTTSMRLETCSGSCMSVCPLAHADQPCWQLLVDWTSCQLQEPQAWRCRISGPARRLMAGLLAHHGETAELCIYWHRFYSGGHRSKPRLCHHISYVMKPLNFSPLISHHENLRS